MGVVGGLHRPVQRCLPCACKVYVGNSPHKQLRNPSSFVDPLAMVWVFRIPRWKLRCNWAFRPELRNKPTGVQNQKKVSHTDYEGLADQPQCHFANQCELCCNSNERSKLPVSGCRGWQGFLREKSCTSDRLEGGEPPLRATAMVATISCVLQTPHERLQIALCHQIQGQGALPPPPFGWSSNGMHPQCRKKALYRWNLQQLANPLNGLESRIRPHGTGLKGQGRC